MTANSRQSTSRDDLTEYGLKVGVSSDDFNPEANETKPTGANLDEATVDFLTEANNTRSLRITPDVLGNQQLTANDFMQYLNIDMELEPELSWVAREMLAAPMPPNAKMIISKSHIVYFHDLENDYFTLEHPLTQRYLKILERQRLDSLALRTKPSVNGLVFTQPDILFHNQFRNLQIPCQDCNVVQASIRCTQCVMSFCNSCYDYLHTDSSGPRHGHTTIPTAVGSFCSSCTVKKPQVFCGNCEDFFCFSCFEVMHKKGYRLDHRATLLAVSDGEIVEPGKKCEECEDNAAAFFCDQCLDNFCARCFWTCHLNGNRRAHTVSKVIVNPLCNQCGDTRASVYCEQCQEILCTKCFTFIHAKGNRQLHLFLDAMNVLLLLERLDPCFQEHMKRARPRVLWAITQLQAWMRGIEARSYFRRRRDLVTKIQRRWRGAVTRRKLLSMLDHYKWRKRQISNYFLPTSKVERATYKMKYTAQESQKGVTIKSTETKLEDLRNTILKTASANPIEDISRTSAEMSDAHINDVSSMATQFVGKSAPKLSVFASYDSKFESGAEAPKKGTRQAQELTTKNIRQARDITLRHILRIDDRTQGPAKYPPSPTPSSRKDALEDAQSDMAKKRHEKSYRDSLAAIDDDDPDSGAGVWAKNTG
eukprot:GEMP01025413.1.p1 GENE.GEMP01025413.1~~GEMP01025413.1.p1  ORF type:complete len:649 (+),score=139.03 GEMP01025413.1:83-2029(+)